MDDRPVICIYLQGRIGNQLFMYSLGKKLVSQYKARGVKARLVLCDSDILRLNWFNALPSYDLPDVEYIHDLKELDNGRINKKYFKRRIFHHFSKKKDYMALYTMEKKWQPVLNRMGLLLCENGYLPYTVYPKHDLYVEGFFQSEKYFADIKEDLLYDLRTEQFQSLIDKYTDIEKIKARNTVCISVKVEHNVGSNMYAVCGGDYWKRAIDYILLHVEKPYFMICSDNVQYVLENLIDADKYEYTVQDKNSPVYVSLAVMSLCKHFVIGNTTFGWWAQYMCKNSDKIVVVPSKWMLMDMPIDIYQDCMVKIEA